MNMKTTKFLAVLAVLAMAFAAVAIMPAQEQDAATGDASSPLADYSTAYTKGAVSLGALTFTPYIQPTATATFSSSTLTVGGYLVANSFTERADAWANTGFTETGWGNAGLMSFALSINSSYSGDEAYYYVYQYNNLIDGYKVTPLTATAAAVSKTDGANPSFEVALYNSSATSGITMKIIKSDTAISFEKTQTEFDGYTAGEDVAVYNIAVAAGAVMLTSTNAAEVTSATATISTDYAFVRTNVTIDKAAAASQSADTIGLTINDGKKLVIGSGSELKINVSGTIASNYNAYGIYTAGAAEIIGNGSTSKVTINDTTTSASNWKHSSNNDDPCNSAVSYGIGGWTSNALKFTNVNVDINQASANIASVGSFGIVKAGLITISSSTVTIDSSNRAIEADAGLTVNSATKLTANGGEKGIIVKGTGAGFTIGDATGTTEDKTTVTASVFNPAGYNGGNNDRWGVRVTSQDMQISNGAVLNADAVLMRDGDLAVYGTLNITGSTLCGYFKINATTGVIEDTYVPSGLIVSDSDSTKTIAVGGQEFLQIYSGATVNISKGSAIVGVVKDSATTNTVKFMPEIDTTTYASDSIYKVIPIVASQESALTQGSVDIAGDFTTSADGKITVTGKVVISGTLDVDLDLSASASLVVPAGKTLTIADGAKITVTDGSDANNKTTITVVGDINGAGQIVAADNTPANIAIYTANPDSLKSMVASNLQSTVTDDVDAYSVTVYNINSAANQAALQAKIDDHIKCVLTQNVVIAAGYEITIPESSIIDVSGYVFHIMPATSAAVAGDLIVKGGKIINSASSVVSGVPAIGPIAGIYVQGILEIDSADVCVDVKVTYNEGYVAMINAKNMKITGELTSDVSVGYGNTMTLDGVTVPNAKKVQAYGTLIFEGNNYVNKGANVYVYAYGKAEVNGNLYVYGAMNVKSSLTITGTVEVSNDDGGATFTNTGMIFNSGTFNVLGYKSSTAVNQNLLIAGYTYNYGTMKITGKATGVIYDLGDLTFNGTAGSAVDDTVVVLMDGVTFKLSSAAGYITVKDDDSFTSHPDAYESDMVTMKKKVKISAGNTAVLYNAKNVTFTETVKITVKEGTWTDETVTKETANIKCFVSNLEMSGSLAAIDDKATSAYTVVTVNGNASSWTVKTGCTATVSGVTGAKFAVGDAAVGKNVRLQMGADVNVTGTLSVVAKTSLVEATDASNYVGVTGTIIVGYECGKTAAETGSTAIVQGILTYTNSTYYIIQDDDANDTYYYTTFANAVEASTLAYDKDLMMLGTNKLTSGDVVIPTDVTVTMMASSTLNIGAKATVTVSEGALLNGVNGTIIVDGMLTVNDKNSGLRFNTGADRFQYQVITENGNVVKYSGILGALNNAVAGDVITMVQSKVIKESFTIPEGVKLVIPTKVVLAVGSTSDKVKVTVNGELQLERSAYFLKSSSTATTPVTTNLKEVELVINGAVIVDDTATVSTTIVKDDYVMFSGKVDGRATTFFSNIEYAGDNVSEGTVTIYGQVVGDVVSFSKGANVSDNIVIVYDETSRSATNPSSINVGTLTLDGVTLIVPYALDTTYTFTGTIVAADAVDYASVASINANGFTLRTYEEVSGTGSVDYLYLDGAINGKMAIQDGIVTVYNTATDVDLYAFTTSTDYFTIGEDATLVVPKDTGAEIGGSVSDEYPAVIDGILYIEGSEVTFGYVEVSGVISVNDTTKVDIALPMILTGSLIVNDTDDKPAKVNVKRTSVTIDATTYYCFGSIVLGDEPGSLGSDASIVGPVSLDAYTYILVYSGDLSEAQINWNSATKESQIVYTEFYINDELYATAIAANSTDVRLISFTELDPSYTTREYTAVLDHKFTLVGLDTSKVIAQNKDVSSTSTYWYYDADKYVTTYKVIGDYDEIYIDLDAALVYGTITVGTGLSLYIDGQLVDVGKYYPDEPSISVGIHNVMVQVQSGYTGDNVTIKFNGAPVTAGTIIVTADMDYFVLAADGATPYTPEPTPEPEKESEWTITTILLCVLVVLIAIMAVIVALRLNRN